MEYESPCGMATRSLGHGSGHDKSGVFGAEYGASLAHASGYDKSGVFDAEDGVSLAHASGYDGTSGDD